MAMQGHEYMVMQGGDAGTQGHAKVGMAMSANGMSAGSCCGDSGQLLQGGNGGWP